MSRNYQQSDEFRRMDQQFVESMDERNECQRKAHEKHRIDVLLALIVDISDALSDEVPDWSYSEFISLRKRVANAIPSPQCPDWLVAYRDSPLVQS